MGEYQNDLSGYYQSVYHRSYYNNGIGTISNAERARNDGGIAQLLQQLGQTGGPKLTGNKPIVVCGGEVKEAKDLDEAQSIAESLAHAKSADAFILKPIKKVAPKRDVVTTDL